MAYNGWQNGSTFTPISTYAGLSADLRRQLTETKIEPRRGTCIDATPPAGGGAPARNTTNKRVQADR